MMRLCIVVRHISEFAIMMELGLMHLLMKPGAVQKIAQIGRNTFVQVMVASVGWALSHY